MAAGSMRFQCFQIGTWGCFVDQSYFLIQWNLETEGLVKYRWESNPVQKYSVNVSTFPCSKLFSVLCGDEEAKLSKKQRRRVPIKDQLLEISAGIKLRLTFLHSTVHIPFRLILISRQIKQLISNYLENSSHNSQPDNSTVHIFDLQTKEIKKHELNHSFLEENSCYSAQIFDIWSPKQNFIYVQFRLFISQKKINNLIQKKVFSFTNLKDLFVNQKWIRLIWNMKQNSWKILKSGSQQANKLSFLIQFTNGFRKTPIYTSTTTTYFPERFLLAFKRRLLQFYDIDSMELVATEIQTQEQKKKIVYFYYKDMSQKKYFYPGFNCFTQIAYRIYKQIKYGMVKTKTSIEINTTKIHSLPFPQSFYKVFMLNELINDCDDDLLDAVLKLSLDEQS